MKSLPQPLPRRGEGKEAKEFPGFPPWGERKGGLIYGGLAQLARASALHAEGQGFDSLILHQNEVQNVPKARENKKIKQRKAHD